MQAARDTPTAMCITVRVCVCTLIGTVVLPEEVAGQDGFFGENDITTRMVTAPVAPSVDQLFLY